MARVIKLVRQNGTLGTNRALCQDLLPTDDAEVFDGDGVFLGISTVIRL